MTSNTNGNALSVEGARNKFLSKVQGIVNNDRNKDYGSAEDSFNTIAAFWTVWLNAQGHSVILDAYDVAAMMDLMKSARLVKNKTHMDSWVDKAGYSACAGGILEQTLEACEKRNEQMLTGKKSDGKDETVIARTNELKLSLTESVTILRSLFPSMFETAKEADEAKPSGKTVVRLLYYVKKNGDIWTPFVEVNDLAKGDLYYFCKTNGYHAVCTTDNEVYCVTHGWSKIKRETPSNHSTNTFYWYTTEEGDNWKGLLIGVQASDEQLNSLANDNGYHALRTNSGRIWDVVNGWRTTF